MYQHVQLQNVNSSLTIKPIELGVQGTVRLFFPALVELFRLLTPTPNSKGTIGGRVLFLTMHIPG